MSAANHYKDGNMKHKRPHRYLFLLHVLFVLLLLAGCGGGSGGGSNPSNAGTSGASGTSGTSGIQTGDDYYPAWADTAPTSTILLDYDGGLSSEANGAILADTVAALQPGDKLEIGAGTWSVNRWWNIVLQGSATAPIWIEAAPGAQVIITRPNASQNVMNLGSGGGNTTEYVCIRGLEITGGSTGMKLYHCSNLWIDQCHIHHTGGVGIAANSEDTDHLYITSNHIHHPGGTAEGMYLGANNSAHVMRHSVVALNHVHDCYGSQGDGIEVKQGSYGNWIVENLVYNCNYPCIIAYGTDGNAVNIIERNVLFNSGDNTMQVQGEAIVRNNLVIDGAQAFSSHDHQGTTTNLTVIHNTFINAGRTVNLSSWNNRDDMVFANNAVYSRDAEAIRFPNGSTGVALSGNVCVGSVIGASSGWITGNGLGDFEDLNWDGARRDATPANGSALLDAADPGYMVSDDLNGDPRQDPCDAGAVEG